MSFSVCLHRKSNSQLNLHFWLLRECVRRHGHWISSQNHCNFQSPLKQQNTVKRCKTVNLLMKILSHQLMVILRAGIRATGLLLRSWRCFTSHPKRLLQFWARWKGSKLISREGHYSHMCHWPMTIITIIITSESSTCLKGRVSVIGSKVWMVVKPPGEERQCCIIGAGRWYLRPQLHKHGTT